MTGGMVVVDGAGHFGGNMGGQFTAAIGARAQSMEPLNSSDRQPE